MSWWIVHCTSKSTSLRYLCNTMPDIYHSLGMVGRFMEKSILCHILAAKRILRYIRGTTDHGVLMPNQQNTIMDAKVYDSSDSDWSGDQD